MHGLLLRYSLEIKHFIFISYEIFISDNFISQWSWWYVLNFKDKNPVTVLIIENRNIRMTCCMIYKNWCNCINYIIFFMKFYINTWTSLHSISWCFWCILRLLHAIKTGIWKYIINYLVAILTSFFSVLSYNEEYFKSTI